jgi:hypothetical protein
MHVDGAGIQPKREPKARLIAVRHLDGRTRAAKRARKLATEFEREIGGNITTAMRIAIDRAAGLVVVAEDARARRLSGDMAISQEDLVRCDRVAAAAVRALGVDKRREPPKPPMPPLSELLARAGK